MIPFQIIRNMEAKENKKEWDKIKKSNYYLQQPDDNPISSNDERKFLPNQQNDFYSDNNDSVLLIELPLYINKTKHYTIYLKGKM